MFLYITQWTTAMKNSLSSEEKRREMFLLHSELLRKNALQMVLYCCGSPLAQQLISPEGGTFHTHGACPLLSFMAVSTVRGPDS